MSEQNKNFEVNVSTEIGRLRKLLIHSPDSGLGKVVPSKAQDWLFEDIVHLETIRKDEYDYYVKLLMYFLDPGKIKGKLKEIDAEEANRQFFKPDDTGFHHSEAVIEIQNLLSDILEDVSIKRKLTASVCAIEGCTYRLQLQMIQTDAKELAKIFISGSMADDLMIFAPIPNLIFTRDVGITINKHILLNKPAKKARSRETLLMRYIFFNHPLFAAYTDNILEIPDAAQHFLRPGEEEEHRTTLEGGDVMMVSENHVLIGCSERTSAYGANEAIKLLFDNNVVDKVTVVRIPNKRDFMHIDTVFTQVKRNVWTLLSSISKNHVNNPAEPISFLIEPDTKDVTEILQFKKGEAQPLLFESIEALLDDISVNELGSKEKTRFIYSGNGNFPYDAREQWTDSCNLLAIKEGVVLGYDRNDKTIEAFKSNGFDVVKVKDLINDLESGKVNADTITDTLILMPSAELSRARGGFHCMSLPLLRDELQNN
ncbi:arginine deiminase family protein [Pedobacter sp. MR2016-24]|uniref:arginine deiminase family protein n=1 Tax=Pedobacter sp. MR2016-24 TaxID=2994466 RepID=UPI0022479BAB|nr:arginine deiminase family protein [Pedobacter sp. MR2016-24]MCX2483888.1 arginine deiminase family protein [Pedobacter sp. MR2016-24]